MPEAKEKTWLLHRTMERRQFLRGTLASALSMPAALSLLEACATSSPTKPSAGGVKLPNYLPFRGPKPDLPPNGAVEPAYLRFPSHLVRSVNETPGRCGDLTLLYLALEPPPAPLAQNAAWQALNKALNVKLEFVGADPLTFATKFATIAASGDLPDAMGLPLFTGLPNLPQFLKAACADLTPHLAGDAVKDYPNLANLPTFSWKSYVNSSGIYAVPIPASQFFNGFFYDKGRFDRLGLQLPKNADDLTRLLKALTRPQAGQYACGYAAGQGTIAHLTIFRQIFRAPNNWKLERGRLIKDIETEEHKAAVGYMRDLQTAGVFNPDAQTQSLSALSGFFIRGQIQILVLGWPGYANLWDQYNAVHPGSQIYNMPMFGHDGGKGSFFTINGTQPTYVAIKKASTERVKELLRVLNFMSAPFGTVEHALRTYGVKDVDYSLDRDGNPRPTDRARSDLTSTLVPPWVRGLGGPPPVLYDPNSSDFARVAHQMESELAPMLVTDPTQGYYSPTQDAKGTVLTQLITDRLTAIINGRAPLSDHDQLVKDWRAQGGDQIRAEYEAAIAKRGG